MKPCASNQIRNPVTKRCVKKTGKIGKSILAASRSSSPRRRSSSPRRASSPRRRSLKPCKSNQVRNPISKRCVKKTGKIGKSIVAGGRSPKRRISPKKGFDVVMQEERIVDEFLAENKDNLVIRVGNTNYLSNKDYFRDQGLFHECKRIARTDPVDIYNAIDFSKNYLFQMNATGIPGGYIDVDEINAMLRSPHQRYTIKPTSRKTKSVASKSIGDILRMQPHLRPQGYLVSAVHCGPEEVHVINKLVK